MMPINVMALFCEDIRVEQSDIITLVGVLPDSINISTIPDELAKETGAITSLPKLGIYIRIKFDPDADIGQPVVRLTLPDGEEMNFDPVPAEVIERAIKQTREKGNPLSGVVSRIVLSPLPLKANGLLKAEVLIGEDWYFAGSLNITMKPQEAATSPSV